MTILRCFFTGEQVRAALGEAGEDFSAPPDDWSTDVRVGASLLLAAEFLARPVMDWVWENTEGWKREIRSYHRYPFVEKRFGDRWHALTISFDDEADAVAFKLRWTDHCQIETVEAVG